MSSKESAEIIELLQQRDELLAACKRLLEESCPFAADADDCECGNNGDGTDDDGRPCEHRQAYVAVARAEGKAVT